MSLHSLAFMRLRLSSLGDETFSRKIKWPETLRSHGQIVVDARRARRFRNQQPDRLETAEHNGRLKELERVNELHMNEHCLRRITLSTCAFDGGADTAGRVARLRTLGLLRARCMEPPGPERPKSR